MPNFDDINSLLSEGTDLEGTTVLSMQDMDGDEREGMPARETIAAYEKEYAEKVSERIALERKVKKLKERCAELEPYITRDWEDRGIDRITLKLKDGSRRTMSLSKKFTCWKRGGVDTTELCAILEENGLGEAVSTGYNGSSLKSMIKEMWDNDPTQIPQQVAEKLTIREEPCLTSISAQ